MSKAFRVFATLTALAALLTLALANWSVATPDLQRHWNAVAAYLVLGFASEASYLKLRVGQTQTQSSVSFIPFLASVFLFQVGWAAAIAALAILGVESIVKRKAPLRVLFNVSQIALSVAAAGLVYNQLGGQPSLSTFRLDALPIAAAVVTYFMVNSVAVSLAVATAHGDRVLTAWVRIVGASLLYDLVTSLLAPGLAYLYVLWQIPGILLLILPIYLVRHLYQVSLQLEQVNRDLLELMVKAIEARDPYTSGHSLRVSRIAEALARELGIGNRVVDQIRTAALLHDVGKIYEEFAPLLRKVGKLDPTERALMQTHAIRSAELVGTISAFQGTITEAVRHHHENFDGTGYPQGIAGSNIPIGARIIMVADTVDAMTTDRPYRDALTFEAVTEEIKRFSGRQFDPELVAVFLRSSGIKALVLDRIQHQEEKVIAATAAASSVPSFTPRFAAGSVRGKKAPV